MTYQFIQWRFFFLFPPPFLANWMWFKKSFHKNTVFFFFILLKQTNKPDLRHVFRCQNNCPCHSTYSFPDTFLGFQNFLYSVAGLHLQQSRKGCEGALPPATNCESSAGMFCAGKKNSIPMKFLNYIIFLQMTGRGYECI